MVVRYTAVLHRAASEAILTAPRNARVQLLAFLDQLEADPFCTGDCMENDDTGRPNQITLVGAWAVTYWSDHAVKEVRIVRIEKAD
jgi:hypothetical protein